MVFALTCKSRLTGPGFEKLEKISGLAWYVLGPYEVTEVETSRYPGGKETASVKLKVGTFQFKALPPLTLHRTELEVFSEIGLKKGDRISFISAINRHSPAPSIDQLNGFSVLIFQKNSTDLSISNIPTRWLYRASPIVEELGASVFVELMRTIAESVHQSDTPRSIDAFMEQADIAPLFQKVALRVTTFERDEARIRRKKLRLRLPWLAFLWTPLLT